MTSAAEPQKRISLLRSLRSRSARFSLQVSSQNSSPKGMGSPQNLQCEWSGSL